MKKPMLIGIIAGVVVIALIVIGSVVGYLNSRNTYSQIDTTAN